MARSGFDDSFVFILNLYSPFVLVILHTSFIPWRPPFDISIKHRLKYLQTYNSKESFVKHVLSQHEVAVQGFFLKMFLLNVQDFDERSQLSLMLFFYKKNSSISFMELVENW